MKNRPISFWADPMYNYIQGLVPGFSPTQQNNTIKIPSDKGYGFVKDVFLDDGLCMRYYHFCLKDNTGYKWVINPQNDEPTYKLLFNFSSENSILETTMLYGFPQCKLENTATLYPVEYCTNLFIPINTWVTKIEFIFSRSWLQQNFPDALKQIAEKLGLLSNKQKAFFIEEALNYSCFSIVNAMALEMNKDAFPIIHIKTKGFVLLNEFLNAFVETEPAQSGSQKSLYYETIIKVEIRLKQHLFTSMPGIAQLSAEFNMSPSSLQRHFKMVFGKNIYQYYLEEKLAVGKDLISSRKKSISEVAYMLGYNKINSFSKVFKKYFGVLPKELNSIKKAIKPSGIH